MGNLSPQCPLHVLADADYRFTFVQVDDFAGTSDGGVFCFLKSQSFVPADCQDQVQCHTPWWEMLHFPSQLTWWDHFQTRKQIPQWRQIFHSHTVTLWSLQHASCTSLHKSIRFILKWVRLKEEKLKLEPEWTLRMPRSLLCVWETLHIFTSPEARGNPGKTKWSRAYYKQ